jgi:putative aldouronate transport system permease protein
MSQKSARPSLWGKVIRDKYLLLLILPCLLYFILFRYLPMFGIVIAFKNYNLFKGVWASDWVGLKHFIAFIHNPDCWSILRNTFLLGFYKLLFGFPAPIILALLLNEVRNAFFKRFVQSISYLPHFISNVVVASMVVLFLSPTSGFINKIISFFGVEPINFLVAPDMFRTIYVASEIWQHVGWETIIYLAALTAIDPQLYEAAKIDGADRWKQTIFITIPSIMPTIIVLFILSSGSLLEIGFEKVFLLSNPATYETADIIATYVYRIGLIKGNFSYGAAIDLFTGVISLAFIYTANWLSRKYGETSVW